MLSEKLRDTLIKQMNAEFESYYLYLAVAAYFKKEAWEGFAHWMQLQSQEEHDHAMKFYNHLLQRGEMPKLLSIAEPKSNWDSPLDAFQDALKHEKKITSLINEALEVAIEVKDRGAENLLSWFVDEQLEEEDTVGTIVERLARVNDDPKGLMLLDTELGSRSSTEL